VLSHRSVCTLQGMACMCVHARPTGRVDRAGPGDRHTVHRRRGDGRARRILAPPLLAVGGGGTRLVAGALRAGDDLLARRAEIDPDGRTRDRPFNSLTTFFCLRHPGTLLPTQRRMAVLDTMRQRHPDIAWQLMIALLPTPMALYDRPRDPEFRDWKQQEPAAVTMAEWLESVWTLVTWLVQDAGEDARRWQQLLDRFPLLPPDRERIRGELAARATAITLGDDGRTDLWETLRGLIAHHRLHAGKQWALPAGELDALQAVEQALAPAGDAVQLYGWLFAR